MISYKRLQCFWIVFILWFVNMGYNAKILRLSEGEICQKASKSSYNSICKNINECPAVKEQMKNRNYKPIKCSGTRSRLIELTNKLIVCCPPTETYSATEKCTEYSKLIYRKIKDPLSSLDNVKYIEIEDCYQDITLITNGRETSPKEFPHMALLCFSEIPDYKSIKRCGGSLISNKFVLTAAHCAQIDNGDSPKYATWARLGDLDIDSNTDDAKPADYKIVERIIHPMYERISHYHDIALFRLEKDVVFSPYVRPICLNTDMLLNPQTVILTGWGRTGDNDNISNKLLQVSVNSISFEKCKNIYLQKPGGKLAQGIVDKFMVCSDVQEEKDTCQGDSGGPNQIMHEKYSCMYKQIGITSFGEGYCGVNGSASVYTRVSNYISWIEENVWPKTKTPYQ